MRTIVLTDPGTLELNYMWLPTWIGMNTRFKQRIERELAPKIEGRAMTDQDLDELNDLVIQMIAAEFPLPGISDYLDGLKFVKA